MKKFKFMPTILMLVLCVGVLAVGVFAITPTKNTISGTITVTSSNPEVEIQVVQVTKNELGEDVETPIGSKYTVRAGVDLEFGDIQFNTATANQVTDVNDIIVRLDVTNKSNEDLGMYFATSASVNAGTAKTESIDVVANVLQAQFSDYTKLPKTNGTASSSVTFHLKDFPTSDINLELNTLTLYFNIEPFNGSLIEPAVKDDAYYESLGDYAVVGKGKTTLSSADLENLGDKTKVKIADGVTIIDYETFQERMDLTEVIIPEGVIRITANTFYCCSLDLVYLPSSITEIEYNAFYCAFISEYVIDANSMLQNIDLAAFDDAGSAKIIFKAGTYNNNIQIIDDDDELSQKHYLYTQPNGQGEKVSILNAGNYTDDIVLYLHRV